MNISCRFKIIIAANVGLCPGCKNGGRLYLLQVRKFLNSVFIIRLPGINNFWIMDYFRKVHPEMGKILMLPGHKILINNSYFQARYSGYRSKPYTPMKTTYYNLNEQLNACLKEREQVADILLNDVNQILAAALLRMQCVKSTEENDLHKPELYLKAAIDKIRNLHYALAKEQSEVCY